MWKSSQVCRALFSRPSTLPRGSRATASDEPQTTGFIQLCNRKGVVKVQYTLEVELKFKREVAGEDCTGVVKMDEVFDDEPEAEVVIDKKCKGKTAEPDRALKEKLCADAVQLVTGMIENMKNTAGEMMSPQSQNK